MAPLLTAASCLPPAGQCLHRWDQSSSQKLHKQGELTAAMHIALLAWLACLPLHLQRLELQQAHKCGEHRKA